MPNNIGILTSATDRDYKKAIGLSLSLKNSGNFYNTAVVCNKRIASKLSKYFNEIIIERSDIRGFTHKLYLDQYSPYDRTLFLDADILAFKKLNYIFDKLSGIPYAARGFFVNGGKSSFGFDRDEVLKDINKTRLVCIDGAGHAYFEKPQCHKVFDTAREIMINYAKYTSGHLADEDIMGVAMTIHNLNPFENDQVVGSPWHAVKKSLHMDINSNTIRYVDKISGETSPCIIHFMDKATPFLYAVQLVKLDLKNNKFDFTLFCNAFCEWFSVSIVRNVKKIKAYI